MIKKEQLQYEEVNDGEYNTIHVKLMEDGTKNAVISDKLPFAELKKKLMVVVDNLYVATR